MEQQGQVRSQQGLEAHGIRNANTVWWNLSTPALYEHAIQRHEGLLAHLGPLVVRTGQYTCKSPRAETRCGGARSINLLRSSATTPYGLV